MWNCGSKNTPFSSTYNNRFSFKVETSYTQGLMSWKKKLPHMYNIELCENCVWIWGVSYGGMMLFPDIQ